MIERHLKNTLPQEYDINPDIVVVPFAKKTRPFTEVDSKSCDEAKAKSKNNEVSFRKFERLCRTCDRIILKVDNSGHEITVIEFEKYLNNLPKRISDSKRCDLIMTDGISHNKIVFCELCCYDEKYLTGDNGCLSGGKRARAREQMKQSVEFLLNIRQIDHYIMTYPQKICLFAYKSFSTLEKPVYAQKKDAEANMQAMFTTASSICSQFSSEMVIQDNHFKFVQNAYPTIYKW